MYDCIRAHKKEDHCLRYKFISNFYPAYNACMCMYNNVYTLQPQLSAPLLSLLSIYEYFAQHKQHGVVAVDRCITAVPTYTLARRVSSV